MNKLLNILLFLPVFFNLSANPMINYWNSKEKGSLTSPTAEGLEFIKNRGKDLSLMYGGAFGGIATHEIGHALAYKALGLQLTKVYVDPFLTEGGYCEARVNKKLTPAKRIFGTASGPIVGIFVNIAALKGVNIYQEYKKSGDIKKAIKEGNKKSAFINDFNLGLTAVLLHNILGNINTLVPREIESNGVSDGLQICNTLEFSPKTIKLINIGMRGAVELSAAGLGGIFLYNAAKKYLIRK